MQGGHLAVAEAEKLVSDARSANITFVEQIISSKKMSAREVAQFSSEIFGYPLLDLSTYDPQQVLPDAIDRKLVQQHRVVALAKRGNRLSVAISDPTNKSALDQIKFQTSLAIDPNNAETRRHLERLYLAQGRAEEAREIARGEGPVQAPVRKE